MKKLLLLAVAGILFCTPAHADFTAKDASAAAITFKNPNACASVVCVPIFALYDPTGVNGAAVPTAGADGASNTANGLLAYSRLLQFNGTTWDRWQGAVTLLGTANQIKQIDGSGNVQPSGDVASRAIFEKVTDGTNTAAVKAASTNAAATDPALVADPRPNSAATISGSTTNPTSTLTLPATTTAYTAGQLACTNATAATCNTALSSTSFAIANSAGGASISRLRISTNDTTSTAWVGQTVQIDLWTAAPTFTNGDRGTWLPATGSASHLATFTCTFPTPVWGDGLGTECQLAVGTGNAANPKLGSGTSIFWSLDALTGSGVTGASKVFTLAAEVGN